MYEIKSKKRSAPKKHIGGGYHVYIYVPFYVAGVVVMLINSLLLRDFEYHRVVENISLLLFAVGFFIMAWYATPKLWNHSLTKLVFTILQPIVIAFSLGIARRLVSTSLGLPPQDFDMTVGILVVIYAVVIWVNVVGVSVSLFLFIPAFQAISDPLL